MEPVTIIAIAVISILGVVSFWAQIVDWFSRRVIPWVREKLGEKAGDLMAYLVCWLDKQITPAAAMLRKGFALFQERILRMKRTYTKTSATTARSSTETIYKTDDGRFIRRTEEEEVAYEDLPAEIRGEMVRQNASAGTLDVRAAVIEKAEERARQDGIVLETAVG